MTIGLSLLTLPLTVGGGFCQSNFNRRPRVFLANHSLCFCIVMGVSARADNGAAGAVIGSKLEVYSQLAMLNCVSFGNTTSNLLLQVSSVIFTNSTTCFGLCTKQPLCQEQFYNVKSCLACYTVNVSQPTTAAMLDIVAGYPRKKYLTTFNIFCYIYLLATACKHLKLLHHCTSKYT